jgi:hypothetical protein
MMAAAETLGALMTSIEKIFSPSTCVECTTPGSLEKPRLRRNERSLRKDSTKSVNAVGKSDAGHLKIADVAFVTRRLLGHTVGKTEWSMSASTSREEKLGLKPKTST